MTGENFSYSNWEPGEPNSDNGEDCYGIYTQKATWNDWLHTMRGLGFICEWDEIISGGLGQEEGTGKEGTDKDSIGNADTKEETVAVKSGNVRLSQMILTFNGKAQSPSVVATDDWGRRISGANYNVLYSNNIDIGQATATITFKNNYSGTIKKTFLIIPKGTSITKATPKKKGFAVKWKKQNSQVTGYEIQYSTDSKFINANTIKSIRASTTTKKVSKLNAKKKYYVRIRTYKTVKVNGKTQKFHSGWSKAKKVTTKK